MSKRARRPTIRDVAEAAGVSVTTVSDAINGKGRVDPATQAKVRTAAAEVGWHPKRSARALRSGQTGIIVFCLPHRPDAHAPWVMNTDYYIQLAAACAVEAVAVGRFVLLAPGPVNLADVAGLDVDGAIVVDPLRDDPMIKLFSDSGVPVVTVDRDLASSSPNWVGIENDAATNEVLNHLAEQGAKTISLLSSAGQMSWLSEVNGTYEAWCHDNAVTAEITMINLERSIEDSSNLVRDMIANQTLPDAIYAVPYGSALGVLQAVTQAGLSVPEDVLVVSGVDGPAMSTAAPSITAVDMVPAAVAAASIRLLVGLIEGTTEGGPVMADSHLVVRDSTRRA